MKNTKRLLAMILIASICAGTVNMPVYAEETLPEEEIVEIEESEESEEIVEGEVTETETKTNEDGTTTDLTTTTTTEIGEDGNITVTVTIGQTTEGTNTDGAVVEGTANSTEVTVTDGEGEVIEQTSASESTTTVTETVTDEESGETTVTETKTETMDELTADGSTTDFDQTTVTETKTDAEGNEIDTTVEVSGTETKTWDEAAQPGLDTPSLEVDLIPGETVTDSVVSDPVTEVTGDLPEGEDDETYNFTTTTTTTTTTLNATLTENKDEVKIDTDLNCPVGPEDYEGKEYYDGSAGKDICIGDGTCNTKCIHYREGISVNGKDYLENLDEEYNTNYVDPKPEDEALDAGYDFVWAGYGDSTKAAAAVVVEELYYLTDENGEIVFENGFPVVDMEKSVFVTGGNGKATEGMVLSATQFALKAENGEYFYAYCMDASTGASPETNRWYQIRNLEDAVESESNPDGYLTEKEAAQIRAIATYGYWGTNANVYETNEDGSLKLDTDGNPIVVRDENGDIVTDSSVRGSVSSLKELLRNTYEGKEDTTVKVRYPGSNNAYEYDILTLIDGLTEDEALAVTQAAIWSLANNGDVTYDQKGYGGVVTDASVIGVLSAASTHNGKVVSSFLNEFKPEKDGESDARMQALYQCLLNLAPIYENDSKEDDTNVIPNEDVFENISLVVEDKVEDHAQNVDEDVDNDVFNTSISFSLAFVPDPYSDDLLVYMTDANGNVINDKNGKPVVRRLAGTNTEGRTAETIVPDEFGVYTITGLQMGENTDFTFDLKLEGTQFLQEGVYIYQAHGGREASQTLVGLATGKMNVEATASMTLSFEVDEMNHVVAAQEWHDKYGSKNEPEETEPEETEPEETDPEETDPEETDPTETEPEETDPVETEPEETEPVETDPVETDPVETDPVETDPVETIPEETEPAVPAEEPVIIIEDEDIPLTDIPDEPIPMTGDSFAWYIVSVIAGLGLAVVSFFDRKKKTNA